MNGSYDNLTNFDWSIRVYVRMDQTSAANRTVWDFNNTTSGTNNRTFLQYNQSSNRLIMRIRTNATNFDAQWALHDNNSATGTGTSSSNKWLSTNRGNVNSDNMCMLTITYDASQTIASNAFKCYWNASQLTSVAVSNNNTRTNNTMGRLAIGAQRHALTTVPWNGLIDEWAFYNKTLSSAEVSNLYDSTRAEAAQIISTTNLITNVSFDDGGTITQYNNNLSNVSISGMSFGAYGF